jgi:hypothetical protein
MILGHGYNYAIVIEIELKIDELASMEVEPPQTQIYGIAFIR